MPFKELEILKPGTRFGLNSIGPQSSDGWFLFINYPYTVPI